MRLPPITPKIAALASVAFIASWATAAWCASLLEWRGVAETVRFWGWLTTYCLGLAWAIWGFERAAQFRHRERMMQKESAPRRPWDILDPQARWYSPLALSMYVLLVSVLLCPPSLYASLFSGNDLRAALRNTLDRHAPQFWMFLAGVLCGLTGIVWCALSRTDANAVHGANLRQSLTVTGGYSLLFLLLLLLLSPGVSAVEDDEMPAGGGQEMMQQTVRIQKIVRKKFVINPYSSILFNPPPIDHVDPKLLEVTQNLYAVGQGGGDGAGFSQGTGEGKIRFYRLKHSDKQWDRNFGTAGDMNMLSEYHVRTRQKIAEKPEYLEIAQLPKFTATKAPPLLYVCGTSTFQLSPAEKKILKQFLIDRHGMILADNHGGTTFHHNFIHTMREVLERQEVVIPRDDVVHRQPYQLPLLPIVVAHGGSVPLGWNVDGRWVVYYHPGALSDAWRDDHAGIKPDIWESCYRLGVNIIFYSRAEKNKWLKSQRD